jgi:hypothetical protein
VWWREREGMREGGGERDRERKKKKKKKKKKGLRMKGEAELRWQKTGA